MKTKYLPLLFAWMAFLFLSACTTLTPVMRTGDGEYIVSRSGDTGFTPVGKLRRKAVADVNRYAGVNGGRKVRRCRLKSETPVPQNGSVLSLGQVPHDALNTFG